MPNPNEEVVQCNSELPRFYAPSLTERELLFVTALVGTQLALFEDRPLIAIHLMKNAAIIVQEDRPILDRIFTKLQMLVKETPP
jgi:hypothetical protein